MPHARRPWTARRSVAQTRGWSVDTQVAIVGAGPAGLLLSHLLHLQGVASIVLEARDRDYVEHRVRAGVLEHGTVETLRSAGVGDRLGAEGMVHGGTELRFARRRHRIDFAELVGRTITVYGQQEVVKDLIARRLADGGDVRFDTAVERVDGCRCRASTWPTGRACAPSTWSVRTAFTASAASSCRT